MMLIQVAPGQSLQTVIDALPADDQPVTIHLAPGVYEEKIALRRPRTCIEGESAETTRITWHDGAAEILPDGKKRGTFRTATLLINARDCALRNVTVENSAYPREQVGQALALYVDGDGFHCEDCTLKSCQDTLFTAPLPLAVRQKNGFRGPRENTPRLDTKQYYRDCEISGNIDFIFGGANAVLDHCRIVPVAHRGVTSYIAAASTPQGKPGYLFANCTVQGNSPAGSVYLGRPWRPYAQAVFIRCELGKHILPEGWHNWGKKEAEKTVFYAEYDSRGEGANPKARAAFSRQLKNLKGYEMETVLAGEDGWNPVKNGNRMVEVKR